MSNQLWLDQLPNNVMVLVASDIAVPAINWVHMFHVKKTKGTLNINVDGAVAKAEDTGAFITVCRDHMGQFIGCSLVKVEGITEPVVLEAMVCAETLCLVVDIHANRFQIASDCPVVKEIQSTPSV
jgi:hypothetical protein